MAGGVGIPLELRERPVVIGSQAERLADHVERLEHFAELAKAGAGREVGGSFGEQLRAFVDETNGRQVAAQEAATAYARHETSDLHGTMIQIAQADISFRFLASVRNRLLESYREIMRMGA